MERLSGLDASFLYLETPAQMMHVCGVVVLDPDTIPGGYSFDAFKAELHARVSAIPSFRRTLRTVPMKLDHPVWVNDDDFDIDRHVHRMALPAPGDEKELTAIAGHLAGIPLDRTRPLWEMYVIEGLSNGKVAVFWHPSTRMTSAARRPSWSSPVAASCRWRASRSTWHGCLPRRHSWSPAP
jgi:diacylglycerol O-acyltransferase